jgi:dTDP-4-dehydrorhamnose 3,5-epimerase
MVQFVNLEPAGLVLVRPRVFRDSRGFFLESYQSSTYRAAGLDVSFVQDNHSRSTRGTLRGLHYQEHPGQAKLVRVARGRIFDVAVDIRPNSPTRGKWFGVQLCDERHEQLFIPVGFAHGFCALSDECDVVYKVSNPYDPATERTLAYDDPSLGVDWPISTPVLSDRDRQGESFAAYLDRVGGTPGRDG